MQPSQLKAVFATFFQPHIRVLFDWRRFQAEHWPVSISVVREHDVLANWFMPWNVDGSEVPTIYNAPGARPIRVRDLQRVVGRFDEARRSRIEALATEFRKSKRPAQILVPVYAPNDTEVITLDGNHRLAATFLSRADFTALVFTVHGPPDSEVLPELRHWSSGCFNPPA